MVKTDHRGFFRLREASRPVVSWVYQLDIYVSFSPQNVGNSIHSGSQNEKIWNTISISLSQISKPLETKKCGNFLIPIKLLDFFSNTVWFGNERSYGLKIQGCLVSVWTLSSTCGGNCISECLLTVFLCPPPVMV